MYEENIEECINEKYNEISSMELIERFSESTKINEVESKQEVSEIEQPNSKDVTRPVKKVFLMKKHLLN